MNFKRLLDTDLGKMFISILLGLGLATMFKKVCDDKNCIIFNGPVISDFEDKTYKYDGNCYKYSVSMEKCDSNKQVIDIETKADLEEFVGIR
jgi:hypothetical protein